MKTLVLVTLLIVASSFSPIGKKCTINGQLFEKEKDTTFVGQIIKEKSDTILLFKASKFPIYEEKIPIVNNRFNYSFDFFQSEAYELVLQDEFNSGNMMVTTFFCEEGKIYLTLYEKIRNKDFVKGSSLNCAFTEYNHLLKSMFWDEIMKYSDSLHILNINNKALSEDYFFLQEKINKTTDIETRKQLHNEQTFQRNTGSMYTPQARKYHLIQDSIRNKLKVWEFDYIDKNSSLLSYYLFMKDIQETGRSCCWTEVDADLINKANLNLKRHNSAFPDHPYYMVIKNAIDGLSNIHDGGRFIDFTGTDINGKNQSLAKIIKSNKLILLDFWSTWCAPCIKTSRELIPVYEEFRKQGFEIVGITQSDGRKDYLKTFIRKEQYPWTNLIDIDGKAGVWDKYNLSNQGGATFLVNSSGRIIGVNLTAGKVKEKLIELLK